MDSIRRSCGGNIYRRYVTRKTSPGSASDHSRNFGGVAEGKFPSLLGANRTVIGCALHMAPGKDVWAVSLTITPVVI